jgi:hypothetical protein
MNNKIFVFFFVLLSALSGCKYLGDCDKYYSDYSCKYLDEQASYDVYYYKNIGTDSEQQVRLGIARTGLISCLNIAVNYAIRINEKWNGISYTCVMVGQGITWSENGIWMNKSGLAQSFRYIP